MNTRAAGFFDAGMRGLTYILAGVIHAFTVSVLFLSKKVARERFVEGVSQAVVGVCMY